MADREGTGRVLGIDVGFSPSRRTTCFCLLSWDTTTARFECRRATSDTGQRRSALRAILQDDTRVDGVAIDGPLGPALVGLKHYRSAEACLSQGCMQKRGKPGQTSSPVGQLLHRHATDLAVMTLELAEVCPSLHPDPIHAKCVVEAFPNAFLAALLDDGAFGPLTRNASDIFWQANVKSGSLDRLCDRLLPGRTLIPSLDSVVDHDDRAGVVCAMTALAVLMGDYVAVGDPVGGDIILPPLALWGRGDGDAPWLHTVLISAVERIRATHAQPGFVGARIIIAGRG